MQGKFVTQAEFESFKKNELSAALSFLSINLKNPNVENQAAARALGYSSYEALQPLFAREAAIRSAFYIEKASEQGNRLTIKSGNIVAVFDFNELAVYAKSLVNGEEFLYLTESNSTAKVDLSIFSKTDRYLLENLLDFKPEVVDGGSKYSFGSTSGLQIVREKDGLSIGLLGKDKGMPLETLRLKFDDCDGDSSEVDLITPKELQIKPCETFYKFVTPQKDTDSGEVRYYNLDSSQFEVNLSSLMFESPEKAFEAIESGDYGWSAEDLEGASLVKVEYKLEHNLTNLSEDAYDDDGDEGCEIDLIAPKSPRVGITMEYVDSRKEDFLRAYKKAAVCFGHSDETIERWMANMEKRLLNADYKLYSNSPIGHLHAAKRIVRNAIRVAIETAPARKEQINKWRTEYSEYCAKEQQRFPSMTFFSFEHAYSKKLKISFKKYKEFFKI